MAPILVSGFIAVLAAIVSALLSFLLSGVLALGDLGIALTFYLAPAASWLLAFVITLRILRESEKSTSSGA